MGYATKRLYRLDISSNNTWADTITNGFIECLDSVIAQGMPLEYKLVRGSGDSGLINCLDSGFYSANNLPISLMDISNAVNRDSNNNSNLGTFSKGLRENRNFVYIRDTEKNIDMVAIIGAYGGTGYPMYWFGTDFRKTEGYISDSLKQVSIHGNFLNTSSDNYLHVGNNSGTPFDIFIGFSPNKQNLVFGGYSAEANSDSWYNQWYGGYMLLNNGGYVAIPHITPSKEPEGYEFYNSRAFSYYDLYSPLYHPSLGNKANSKFPFYNLMIGWEQYGIDTYLENAKVLRVSNITNILPGQLITLGGQPHIRVKAMHVNGTFSNDNNLKNIYFPV